MTSLSSAWTPVLVMNRGIEMTDIAFTDRNHTATPLRVIGKTQDTAVQILQRVIVMMLSNAAEDFRSSSGTDLTAILGNQNVPNTASMDSLLAIACQDVLAIFDRSTRNQIKSLTALSDQYARDGIRATVTVTLINGDTASGVIE